MIEKSTDKILENLHRAEESQLPMTVPQQKLMEDVKACLDIMDGNLMMPTPKLRDALMEATGCSRTRAYEVILLAREALGNRKPTAKLVVREDILEMMREAYQAAQQLDPEKKVKALTDIANALARAFATSDDDGELLDAAKHLTIDKVVIVSDPAALGITQTDEEKREIDRMKKEAGYEDVDFEELLNESGDEGDIPA